MPTPYVLQGNVTVVVPPAFLLQALDDDGDGVADPGIWEAIAQAAAEAVDSRLGQRYGAPFSNPLPAIVVESARIFAAEMLYARRGIADAENPFSKRAKELRDKLDAIGQGKEPLTPETTRAKPSASLITDPAKTTSKTGRTAS